MANIMRPVRQRVFGSDAPMMAWFRENAERLPSVSVDVACSLVDIDMMIHAYQECIDGVGSREVQALMKIEGKTRDGEPTRAQLDTLWKDHIGHTPSYWAGMSYVRNFGWFVLSMSGTRPDDSDRLRWGIFQRKVRTLKWHAIDLPILYQLLRFEIDPRTFRPHWWRRHHLTRRVVETNVTLLGFPIEEVVVYKS